VNLLPAQGDPRVAAIVSAIFVAFHAIMFLWIVPIDAWKSGGDLSSYLDPATALYRYGAFVDLDDPTRPYVYRQPAYTIILAALMWLTDGQSIRAIFPLQAAMLLATGLMTWSIARVWTPRAASFVLIAVLANPNATGVVYIVTPQNLLAPIFALAALIVFGRRSVEGAATWAWSGLVFGASCLVRFVAQGLVFLWPLIATVLTILSNGVRSWRVGVVGGALGLILGLAAMSPWLWFMKSSGQGFSFSPPAHRLLFVNDNMAHLEMRLTGVSNRDAKTRIGEIRDVWRASQGSDFQGLAKPDQDRAEADHLIGLALDYPPGVALRALLITWANLFAGGGATNLQLVLGIEPTKAWDIMRDRPGYNYVTAFFTAVAEASPGATIVSVAAIGYVVVMRLLGAIGVIVLIRRRDWPLLATILGICLYYALLHLFIAESIYRIPIEPFLVLLAAPAIDAMLKRRENASPATHS